MDVFAAKESLNQHECGHGEVCGTKQGPALGRASRRTGNREAENRAQPSVPAMILHCGIPPNQRLVRFEPNMIATFARTTNC